MKRVYIFFAMLLLIAAGGNAADGWPARYSGVMLQGFYWNSYTPTKWTNLEAQADELSRYFSLVWLPQSGKAVNSPSMGYDDLYWFSNYNSSFGNETELRSLITTLKNKGVGTIADVVINHRGNMSTWTDFPSETYNGKTYSMYSTDIVLNDDGGATKTWADKNGVTLSSYNDSGEGWSGMRDLDHNSANVQKNVNAYLAMLLNDFGYAGFRYDMVKGYSGYFSGLYNSTANPGFSVGEYWDGNADAVKNWINATKVGGVPQSAAFDFPLRYTIRDAVNNGNWNVFSTGAGLAKDSYYKKYSVTFAENHDTETRDDGTVNDPIRKDTLAANAYLLAMPGTPCVFLKHWIDCKKDIKQMIEVRKTAGINNLSVASDYASGTGYYVMKTAGDNADLLTILGTNAKSYTPSAGWLEIQSGYHYRYYISSATQTAWTSLPSGKYEGAQSVILKAVSANTSQLVYTTDGTDPVVGSTTVTSGTSIVLPYGDVTLKVGLLVGGSVTGVITRQYTTTNFDPYTITVYTNTDNVGWTNINYWTWGGDGSHSPTNTAWPGEKVTNTTVINGKTWYYKTFKINTSTDVVNFVFNTNTGSPQTVNVENINHDSYFEISTQKSGSNYLVKDVTTVTGISTQNIYSQNKLSVNVHATDGRLIRSGVSLDKACEGLSKGIYIINNRKYIVR